MSHRHNYVRSKPKSSELDTHIYVNCVDRYNNTDEKYQDDCNFITDSEASYCEVAEVSRDAWHGWDGRRSDGHPIYLDSRDVQAPNPSCRLAAERDALASALASERARSEREARAHDARLAELHGVIAELVRRRDREAARRAIPEEPDEQLELCDSQEAQPAQDDASANDSEHENQETPSLDDAVEKRHSHSPTPRSDGARSKQTNRQMVSDVSVQGSRSHSPGDVLRYPETTNAGRGSVAVASRVRLRRTNDSDKHLQECSGVAGERACCEASCEGVASDLAAGDAEACGAALALANARADRYLADCTALEAALAHATSTAQRLSLLCARHESCSVALSEALRASDRAVEAYDVLLALAETRPDNLGAQEGPPPLRPGEARAAAVCVARALLHRLERECEGAPVPLGRPLLSPGPWQDDMSDVVSPADASPWSAQEERSLRAHVSRLKARGTRARSSAPPPVLDEHYPGDVCACRGDTCGGVCALAATTALYQDMETAVLLQEVAVAREERAAAMVALHNERHRNNSDVAHAQNLTSEVMSHRHRASTRNDNKDGATDRRKRKSRQRKLRDHIHYTHAHARDARTHANAHGQRPASEHEYAPQNVHTGSTKEDAGSRKDCVAPSNVYMGSDEVYAGFGIECDDTSSEKDGAEKQFVGSLKEYTGIPKDYAGTRENKMSDSNHKNGNVGSTKDVAGLTKEYAGATREFDPERESASQPVFGEDSSNKNSGSSSPLDVYPDSSAETFRMSPASNNLDSSPHKELSEDEILSRVSMENRARFRSGSLRLKDECVTRVHGIGKQKLNLSSQNLRTASETNL